jgi:hypothetical protein
MPSGLTGGRPRAGGYPPHPIATHLDVKLPLGIEVEEQQAEAPVAGYNRGQSRTVPGKGVCERGAAVFRGTGAFRNLNQLVTKVKIHRLWFDSICKKIRFRIASTPWKYFTWQYGIGEGVNKESDAS